MTEVLEPSNYVPARFLKPRAEQTRKEVIASYERGIASFAKALKDSPPWQTEVRCDTTRIFMGLDGLKPTDPDVSHLYRGLMEIDLEAKRRELVVNQ